MVYLINVNAKTHCKDCRDWEPLKGPGQGLVGDPKYCNLSLKCRQIGMKSDWYQFYNPETGFYEFDYFCTGMRVTEENKKSDDEVS